MQTRKMLTALVAVFSLVGILAGPQIAFALQAGDTVEILIPADSNQPEPPAGVTDKLIFTGGRITAADISGCGAGTHPVQNAVLVDPAGGRSGRIVGVIASTQTDAIPPGTKLTGLSAAGTCTIAGTSYNRYQGTVE